MEGWKGGKALLPIFPHIEVTLEVHFLIIIFRVALKSPAVSV